MFAQGLGQEPPHTITLLLQPQDTAVQMIWKILIIAVIPALFKVFTSSWFHYGYDKELQLGISEALRVRGVDSDGYPRFPCPDGVFRIAYYKWMRKFIFDGVPGSGLLKVARKAGCKVMRSRPFERNNDQMHAYIYDSEDNFGNDASTNGMED
ncbi:hypothetical protein PMAYCL1PPCAC_04682, partial [Pristionchus mayeri]